VADSTSQEPSLVAQSLRGLVGSLFVSERAGLSGHAFISYVHENSRQVDQLQRTLEEAGIRVWRDTDDLWPGEDWRAKIRDAITHKALVFIICFSKHGIARMTSYQNEELSLAIEEMRKRSPERPWLIPVRFDDCDIPDRDIGGGRTLRSIQHVDLFGLNAEAGAKRLAVVVLRILGREPIRPEEPESSAWPVRDDQKTGTRTDASPQQEGSPGISATSSRSAAMFGPRPEDPSPGKLPDNLATALQHLRRQAGNPSTRTIGRAASYSHTTVAQALNGSRRPRWEVVEQIVRFLGGDVEQFRTLWLAALEAEEGPPPSRDTLEADPLAGSVQGEGGDSPAHQTWQVTATTDKPGLPRRGVYPPPDDWLGSAGVLKLYQPVLFVGLGGSGCDIGAALERRLRREFCGPDGKDFIRRFPGAPKLPYQLPKCVQFVYADMSRDELDRMPSRVVPSSAHIPAVLETAHYLRDLAPPADTYPELARSLRLREPEYVEQWLPPAGHEPMISLLGNGAIQFPTAGRAALFGVLMDSIAPAVRGIREAVGKLATSGEDLAALGGSPPRGVDVFVAFSVAGGTGCGIFYDYLHLIADEVWRQTNLRLKIYPLVLMPSAFEAGLGGGRAAGLNAGRALLDLFRLVDRQNDAEARMGLHGAHDERPHDPDEAAVTYPGNQRIAMRPGTAQTGILFSPPPDATREDMYRSIVSLVVSMVGTEMAEHDSQWGMAHQSFADSFVSQAAARQVWADDGIGNRGVSTALVASLTSPFDHLADLISGRLLREAVRQLSAPEAQAESNQEYLERFLSAANVGVLNFSAAKDRVQFDEPLAAQGARQVATALNDRAAAMRRSLDAIRATGGPRLAEMFNPRAAIQGLLTDLDVFRVQRVASGHPDLDDHMDIAGAAGLLRDRMMSPVAPDGCDDDPPAVPKFSERFRPRQVRWTDPAPIQVRQAQDSWYRWQTEVAWAQAWRANAHIWQRLLAQVETDLRLLTRAFIDFADSDERQFGRWAADLYRARTGVTYLLPFGDIEIEQLMALVKSRLLASLDPESEPRSAAPEAGLVQALVLARDGWQKAYETSLDSSPERAVAYVRDLVTTEVKACLRSTADDRRPLMPRLSDLLAEAAGHPGGGMSLRGYIEEFREKLATLVPPGFTPQGSGPMKVLVFYPADTRSFMIETYLRETINLPRGGRVAYDMRHTLAESITVVMFRTEMGLTDVAEVRDTLRLWARALARPEPGDFLRWRQRTGYDFGYLATTEEHRVEILHRILCALWNGKATAEGDLESPDRITVEVSAGDTLSLELSPLEHASSWGSLLRGYEQFALDGDDTRRLICARLLRELPAGLDSRPRPPAHLYQVLRDLAGSQIDRLDEILMRQAATQRSRTAQMRRFWTDGLPAALDREFSDVASPVARSLRELEQVVFPQSGE
jgi:hypothetical protein